MAKKDKEFEDDGRVIADMNVDGMPWYRGRPSSGEGGGSEENSEELKKLGRKDTFHLILGVLGAAFAVTAIFAIGYFLFILFCRYIWFRV